MFGVDSLILRLNKIHPGHSNLSFLRPLFFRFVWPNPNWQAVLPARCESTALVVRLELKGKTISWHLKGLILMAVLYNHECSYTVLIVFFACINTQNINIAITPQYRFHECYSFHVMSSNSFYLCKWIDFLCNHHLHCSWPPSPS